MEQSRVAFVMVLTARFMFPPSLEKRMTKTAMSTSSSSTRDALEEGSALQKALLDPTKRRRQTQKEKRKEAETAKEGIDTSASVARSVSTVARGIR